MESGDRGSFARRLFIALHCILVLSPNGVSAQGRGSNLSVVAHEDAVRRRAAAIKWIPAPDSEIYQNETYGISLKIPAGHLACVSDFTNHGVAIMLHEDACEADDRLHPEISVFAGYTASADKAPTLHALVKEGCAYGAVRKRRWLHKQRIGNRFAEGCRVTLDDGTEEIRLYVLRATRPETPWNWIEISAWLATTPENFDADSRTFQQVLKNTWIHPDGPSEEDHRP